MQVESHKVEVAVSQGEPVS